LRRRGFWIAAPPVAAGDDKSTFVVARTFQSAHGQVGKPAPLFQVTHLQDPHQAINRNQAQSGGLDRHAAGFSYDPSITQHSTGV